MSDIMSKSIRPLTAALVCLGLGLSIQTTAVRADDAGYLTDTAGDVVKTSSSECWRISDGLAPPVEACGDVIAVVEEVDPCSLDDDGDGINNCEDKCPDTKAGAKVDAQGCEIIGDLVLHVTADHFDFDKAVLKPAMKDQLDDVMAQIEASPGDEHIMIVGHTDSIGTEAYNQGLSERRARAAADYLIEKGFPQDKIAISGAGESEPVADNSTKQGRAENRRVEIKTH